MDINQSSLPGYKTNKQSITRSASGQKAASDSIKTRDSSSLAQNPRLSDFKEGQVIKGQVIDHRYHEVTVRLEPGNQIITARLSGDIPLSIGQDASFQVTGSSPDSLVLKYLPVDNTAISEALIQKALSASGLTMTDRNKALVTALLDQSMPIDKQTLQTLIQLSHKNREASPITLVLMYKNNIPITPENVKQFEAYRQGTAKIIQDITAITKNLSELFISSKEYPSVPADAPLLKETVNRMIQINSKLLDVLFQKENPLSNLSKVPEIMPESLPATTENNSTAAAFGLSQEAKTADASNAIAVQPAPGSASNITTLGDILRPAEQTALMENLKTFPGFESLSTESNHGSIPLQKLLSFIRDGLLQSDQSALKLLQSAEYSHLLENAFLQRWTVNPGDIAQKAPVQELYQNLQQDTEKLGQLIKGIGEDKDTLRISEPLKNLQENVSFLKDLNQMFTYVQLPVQLRDRQLHSELYVFTRKRALQDKKDDLSVLLHLDMEYLGPLNIHIKMQQNQIHANFYTDNKEASQLLADNLSLLENTLQKRGYQFKAELTASYKEPDFIKDLIEQETSDTITKNYTFDIRT
jgi:chaperonin cofactor prefoldin